MRVNLHCNMTNGDIVDKTIRVVVVPRQGESIWLTDIDAHGQFDVTHVGHEDGKVEIVVFQQ